MSPEMQRKVDATRAQRLAAENAIHRQVAAQSPVSFFPSASSSFRFAFHRTFSIHMPSSAEVDLLRPIVSNGFL